MFRTIPFRKHQELKHKREAIRRAKQNNTIQYNNPYFWGRLRRFHSFGIPPWEDGKYVGIYSTTPTVCHKSLGLRKFGGQTRKEISNMLDALDELEELGYNRKVIKKCILRYEDIWSWD